MARKVVNSARLDQERIAAAALALVTEKGLAGFTIRALAKALGVTPMALYYHVGNKATLAAMVIEAHDKDLPAPPTTGDWREDMWAMARWSRDSVLARPAIQQIHQNFGVWTPAAAQMVDRWNGLWRQSGLDRKRAALASMAGCHAINGLLAQQSAAQRMEASATEKHPQAPSVPGIEQDPAVVFELAIRALIDGLHARLMQEQTKSSRAKAAAPRAPQPKKSTRKH